MKETIKSILVSSIIVKSAILANENMLAQIEEAAMRMADAFKRGNRVFFCGNGGSAADAQHLAAEFTGRFYIDRRPLPAEALHVNTSFMTAVANDYSYEKVYERAVQAHGRVGDVLVGMSTSGNSKNVLLAQEEARRMGMMVISFTGESGGAMKHSCDMLFAVPSSDTPRIQEAHMLIGHTICQLVEAHLFQK